MRWFLLWLALFLPACKKEKVAAAPPPPPKVTVATPVRREIEPYEEVPGRTRATERVEIRARVTGFLEKMHYEVGAREVKAGDVLFTIEKTEYQAQRDQAFANLVAAKASLEKAESDLERFTEALKANAVAKVQVTQARAEKLKAEAEVLSAKAALQRAELNLSYCDVRSPIDGIPGRNRVDLGNLVGPQDVSILTTVVKRAPIYVYFEVPEKYLNAILRLKAQTNTQDERPRDGVRVRVATPGDEGFPHEGRIDWAANEVDPNTGTLEARALLPNEDGALYSGVFVRVRLVGQPNPNQILVEERAIATDLGGKYVLALDEKNVVQRKYIELGQLEGKLRVVASGLEGNERYVTVGVLRARPGLPAEPVEAAASEG